MNDFNFGCVGVGQCGVNLAKHFSKHFKTVVIDTNEGNLNDCKEIENDLKFLAGDGSGAGKKAIKGKEKIEKEADEITELLELNLFECDFVWVASSLGGGTGTLGHLIISTILDSLCIPHGLFLTLPDDTEEGIDEIMNAYLGLNKIEDIRESIEYLSSIIMIENKELDDKVMSEYVLPFEEKMEKGNEYIFNKFYELYKYSQEDSSHSFDSQDYMRILNKKGYMTFGEKIIEDVQESSDNVLVNKIKSTWQDGVFIQNLDYNSAKGMAMVVDRPEGFDHDGQAIKNLLKKMKEFLGYGTFCTGVYKTENGLFNKADSLKMITCISGMSFPQERYNEIEEKALKGAEEYENKNQSKNLNPKLDKLKGIIGEGNKKKERRKRKTFSVFGDAKEKRRKKSKPTNWDNDKLKKIMDN